MKPIVIEARVQIAAHPVDPNETTQERIEREQYQARLDAWAGEIARRIESTLTPVSYEEAFLGAMLLGLVNDVPPSADQRKAYEAYEDAKAKMQAILNVKHRPR